MVLVTTRKAVGVSLGVVKPLCLGPLPADSSMKLLVNSAGSSTAWKHNEAAELVKICGYNALAITILAGLIKNQYCSPTVRACLSHRLCLVCIRLVHIKQLRCQTCYMSVA